MLLNAGSAVSNSPSTSIAMSDDLVVRRSLLPKPPATTVAVATTVAFRVPLAILNKSDERQRVI